jgi:hypothetical protein
MKDIIEVEFVVDWRTKGTIDTPESLEAWVSFRTSRWQTRAEARVDRYHL